MNSLGSSEYMTVFTSITRASFLNMRADQSSSWLIIIDHFALQLPLQNVQKWQYFATFLNFVFQKHLVLFKTFFGTVEIKDSCRVDIEDKRFYLLFLRLI